MPNTFSLNTLTRFNVYIKHYMLAIEYCAFLQITAFTQTITVMIYILTAYITKIILQHFTKTFPKNFFFLSVFTTNYLIFSQLYKCKFTTEPSANFYPSVLKAKLSN